MRTPSAFIAAPLCALALSGAILAAERDQGRVQASPPYWLELRTEVAAENSWPNAKTSKTKLGRSSVSNRQTIEGAFPATLVDIATAALSQGVDVLRDWGKAAERLQNKEPASFDVAGN